jgi:hypothetical protein
MKRRFFLRSAGGLVLAAPFLPSLQGAAHADPSALPRRSVIFHSPNGCLTNRWFPKVEHGPIDASALAGTTLEVLSPLVHKLLFPRGLRAINGYGSPQTIDPHDQAMASKLTCALLDASSNQRYALSHSLDHEIARQKNPGGGAPLVLSVGPSSIHVKSVLSYSAAGTPFPAVVNPLTVFNGLSGVLSGQSGEMEHLRRRRQSVLDAVRDDLHAYQRLNMSSNDQKRINTWLALVRDTEMGAITAACNQTSVGIDAASVNAVSQSTSIADAFTLGGDMMMKLAALSMLCDANRSIVLSFPGYVTFDWDGIHHAYDHAGLAHRNGSFAVGGACLPGVLSMLAEIDTWYAAKYAKLVALLDSLPEGDVTLLDNTATVWLQEFSDGAAHNLNNMPIVIAGSAGGYLRQGASVNVEGREIGAGNSESSCAEGGDGTVSVSGTGSVGGKVPINKLYVTLLNALGCTASNGGPVTSFGKLDGVTADGGITDPGELSGLKA